MPSGRLSVVVTRRLPEPVETRMKELFDVTLRDDDTPMSRDELAKAMAEADILVPTLTDTIDANLLARAGERLKLIANFGAGFDHIDVASALQRGILVSNTPGVSADDTADMTMALMMSVTRRIPEGLQQIKDGGFSGFSPTALLGTRGERQATRDFGNGACWPSGCAACTSVWYADPLSQSSSFARRDGSSV